MKLKLELCVIIGIFSLVLSGCNSESIQKDKDFLRFETACIEALKKRLKSPSSFQLINKTDVSKKVIVSGEDEKVLRARYSELIAKDKETTLTQKEDLELARMDLKILGLNDVKNGRGEGAKLLSVIVEYDAQNAFGALIRGIERCEYNAPLGDFGSYADHDDVLIGGKTYTDWLIERVEPSQ